MLKKSKKALSLTTQTLRSLDRDRLIAAAGGFTDESADCKTLYNCPPPTLGCTKKCKTE